MPAQVRLSAFGDEIADGLSEQLATLGKLRVGHLELRGVWGKNVLALSNDEVAKLGEACRQVGVAISAIGSPVGKSPIEQPLNVELNNLSRSIEIAAALDVKLIRVFSFYPPEGTPVEAYNGYVEESARRLSVMADRASLEGVTLLLENEKDIVGDTIARCHSLLTTIDSPALGFAWDPANFVQVGEMAATDAGWPLLGRFVEHVHVKDAVSAGDVRPAGEGDGQVGRLLDRLADCGYAGFLALEPHLAIAGHSSGFSGPDGMAHAVDVLRRLMEEHDVFEIVS